MTDGKLLEIVKAVIRCIFTGEDTGLAEFARKMLEGDASSAPPEDATDAAN